MLAPARRKVTTPAAASATPAPASASATAAINQPGASTGSTRRAAPHIAMATISATAGGGIRHSSRLIGASLAAGVAERLRPAGDLALPAARHRQRIGGDVLGHHRAGADDGAVADL